MSKNDEPNAMELAPIAEARMIFEAEPQRTRQSECYQFAAVGEALAPCAATVGGRLGFNETLAFMM